MKDTHKLWIATGCIWIGTFLVSTLLLKNPLAGFYAFGAAFNAFAAYYYSNRLHQTKTT